MIKRKSYILLFFAASMLLIFSLFSGSVETLDVNIKDTYYIISNIQFYQCYSVLLLVLGLLYWGLSKAKIQLFSILSLIHINGTLVLFLLEVYLNYQNTLVYQPKAVKYIFDPTDYNLYLTETLLSIIFLQFLFIINIFASIIRKWNCFANSQGL